MLEVNIEGTLTETLTFPVVVEIEAVTAAMFWATAVMPIMFVKPVKEEIFPIVAEIPVKPPKTLPKPPRELKEDDSPPIELGGVEADFNIDFILNNSAILFSCLDKAEVIVFESNTE